MLSISRSSVPDYLQSGDLFASFWEAGTEDAVVEVPDDVVKSTCSVDSADELRQLLSSLRFWLVKHPPVEVIEYVLRAPAEQSSPVLKDFRADLPYITALEKVRDSVEFSAIITALQCGVLEIVQYILSFVDEVPPCNTMCDIAAKAGHLNCLQYLHQQGWGKLYASTTVAAAEGGSLVCMQYLHKHKCSWDRSSTAQAAKSGHLHILQFLHENGCPWSWEVVWACVLHDHLDCLQYALAQRCPKEGDTICVKAVQFGRIECLIVLRAAGCVWEVNVPQEAAKHGHLNCLQYAHENGCRWDADTCIAAAKHGRLDCLKYAHEHGCPWNSQVRTAAKINGYRDCVQYAIDHGCPASDEG